MIGRLVRRVLRGARGLAPRRPAPAILMYHRVAEDSFDPWGLTVSPAHFEEQLRCLKANRTLLPLGEFAARHGDGSLPEDAAAVTFDDGYSCNATDAAPMLENLRVPATIFLPVEVIERATPFWWDELQSLVLGSSRQTLRLGDTIVELGERSPEDSGWKPGAKANGPRQRAFQRLWALLRPLPPGDLERSMTALREQAAGDILNPPARPMTPAEVRAIASDRIRFGSHALTHPWLASLQSTEKAREIGDSMARCEALAGARPVAFAYPYGNFDSESEDLVREAGFTCACATVGACVSPRSRPFALPRLQVGNWPGERLARMLATAPR